MPESKTTHFDLIRYSEETVITFSAGLPGFEEEKRFLPVEQAANKPIVFLQSLSRPDLCFLTLPASVVQRDYVLRLNAEDLIALGLPEDRQPAIGTDVICLIIVSVTEEEPATANLLAPLVVNLRTRRAIQAIQSEEGYSHQHRLFQEVEEGVCS